MGVARAVRNDEGTGEEEDTSYSLNEGGTSRQAGATHTTQRITISKSLSICRFVDRPTQPAGIVQDACKAMKILKSLHENFDARILLFEPVTNL